MNRKEEEDEKEEEDTTYPESTSDCLTLCRCYIASFGQYHISIPDFSSLKIIVTMVTIMSFKSLSVITFASVSHCPVFSTSTAGAFFVSKTLNASDPRIIRPVNSHQG